MKKLFFAGSMVAALFILSSSVAQAQVAYIGDNSAIPASNGIGTGTGTNNPTATVTTHISQVIDLAVTSGQTVAFNFDDIAKLDAGIEQQNAVSLTFRSNLPWIVNVQANTANFTGDSNTIMPASLLQYQLHGGTYAAISNAAPTPVTGTQTTRGTGTIGIDYKMNPRYNYGPGDYAIVLTYTITND